VLGLTATHCSKQVQKLRVKMSPGRVVREAVFRFVLIPHYPTLICLVINEINFPKSVLPVMVTAE